VPTAIIALLVGLVVAGGLCLITAQARASTPRIPTGLLDLARQLEGDWPAKLAMLRASGVPLNAYDNIISRTDAGGLIPEEVSKQMLTNLQERAEGSAARKLFRSVPVGRAQVRFPVLSALPVAYWVTGDTGLKQTSEVNWANKFLNIEELAVIIPIPENVLDDTDTPIWDQVQPLCEEAAARLIDGTVFFGTNAPASFPTNVVAAAIAAGNTTTRGTNNAANGGIVGDHSAMLATLEADGYDATGGLANRTVRGFVRQARNSQGDRYGEIMVDQTAVEIDGVRYTHPMRGLWPTASGSAELIALDGAEFVIGIRQDISWKLLDQAVIQDNTGAIVYNLAQQDMVAMRMTMRAGWQVSNAINYDQAVEANRYPAAVLVKP
jgi:HK97 family phage major capsid protein